MLNFLIMPKFYFYTNVRIFFDKNPKQFTNFAKNNQFMPTNKISIRFFDDREVRAVWSDDENKWYFSVLDIIGVLNNEDDYSKNRNYWKYLKNKLRKEQNELVSATNQLKILAADGKRYNTDVLDNDGVIKLAQSMPNTKSARFIQWFTYSDETIDGKSKTKAYALFESGLIDSIEVGTIKGLQQIHSQRYGSQCR